MSDDRLAQLRQRLRRVLDGLPKQTTDQGAGEQILTEVREMNEMRRRATGKLIDDE